jgi:hypothetical protein
MPPPLPLLCSSAFVVVLLLLLCRPLGANGRAAPPGASPPSPGAPAGQPVQQVAPAVNGTVAAAGFPAAAAPPPLGRMDQSFLLFYGVSVCSCCGAVPGWVLDPRFHGVASAKFRLLVLATSLHLFKKPKKISAYLVGKPCFFLLEWWGKCSLGS